MQRPRMAASTLIAPTRDERRDDERDREREQVRDRREHVLAERFDARVHRRPEPDPRRKEHGHPVLNRQQRAVEREHGERRASEDREPRVVAEW